LPKRSSPVVLVSVTRCWLTPPAAMVMDMVDTIVPFLCAGSTRDPG
jgi:hypothetical protein